VLVVTSACEALGRLRFGTESGGSRFFGEYLLPVDWRPAANHLYDAVRNGLAHAYTYCLEHKERGNEAMALCALGDIAAQHDSPDVEQAQTHYLQALALATELGMRPLQAHCHLGLGTLYARTGQWEQARAELAAALVLYRDMAMTFWLPQTEAALAQVEEQ
jgi:tetratricopeptide (TPR) repeat protein